jgi:glycosyltransferase involved in cell wall biosynthesis
VRIGLDASYSVDKHPSGIAIYSREILDGLAAGHVADRFTHYYRPKQYCLAPAAEKANIQNRRLLPLLGGVFGKSDVFHALNQRVDRRMGRRVVATFHDLFVMTNEYSSAEFRRRFTQQARTAARNSDMIIAVSQFTANQVHDLLGVERSRIRVIVHGTHLPEIHLPEITGQGKEKMILSVGAIQLRKNTASGYGAEAILARIASSRAKERIAVAGYVSDDTLKELYSRAAIFTFPSLDEGFGIPVLEAMAYGLPVVTSNCSALPEVAGDAAVLVDPTRVDEIAGALLDLVNSEERRTRLASAGRARAECFSWQRAVEETYGVYRVLGKD